MIGWIKILGLIIFLSTIVTILLTVQKKFLFHTISPSKEKPVQQSPSNQPPISYQKANIEQTSTSLDTITITQNTFYHHFSKKASNLILIKCHFYYGRQDSIYSFGCNGGAIYLSSLSIDFDQCLFQNNYASLNGGAVYIRSTSSLQIKNTIFHRNTANYFCGAIFLHNVFKAEISYSNFSENAANEVSSISVVYCKKFLTQNLIFYHNYANYNGTVFIEKSNFIDNNSMFIKNQAAVSTSIRLGGHSTNSFISTKFWDQEKDPSILSTKTDSSHFSKCVFSKEFNKAFISNNGSFKESESTLESPIMPNDYVQYPPLPTREVLNKTQAPQEINDPQMRNTELSTNMPQWRIMMLFSYFVTLSILGYAIYNHVTWQPKQIRLGRNSSNLSTLSNLSRDYSSDRFHLDALVKRRDSTTNFGESDSKFEDIDLQNLL